MFLTFESHVDAFEVEGDRIGVRFSTKTGYYWVNARAEELVGVLRLSLHKGDRLEVTYEPRSFEIADVKVA